MHFGEDNIYVLANVVGKYDNPVHKSIIGKTCVLDHFVPNQFGWFLAEFDDGYHRICTSVVKGVSVSGVSVSDEITGVTVTTANSVYTFLKPEVAISNG